MPALDNARHERFCQLMAGGNLSRTAAYEAAYGATGKAAGNSGSRLMEKVGIVQRIDELQLKVEENTVLTLAEKRTFLRSVVTTPIGVVDEHSALAQRVKRSTRTTRDGRSITETEVELPSKLKALELDAKLAGELDDSSSGAAVMVNVALLGMPLGTIETD